MLEFSPAAFHWLVLLCCSLTLFKPSVLGIAIQSYCLLAQGIHFQWGNFTQANYFLKLLQISQQSEALASQSLHWPFKIWDQKAFCCAPNIPMVRSIPLGGSSSPQNSQCHQIICPELKILHAQTVIIKVLETEATIQTLQQGEKNKIKKMGVQKHFSINLTLFWFWYKLVWSSFITFNHS